MAKDARNSPDLPPPLVIGMGNALHRDDGVAHAVVRELLVETGGALPCITCQGDATALLDLWRGYRRVILVDAMRSGVAPGTVQRFSTAGDAPPPCTALHCTHAIGIFEAMRMASALDEAPDDFVLYGIEVEHVGYGETLSPSVEASIAPLARRILAEVAIASLPPRQR